MFGYIYINEQELKLKEYTAYRSFYCGLCRNLHKRYGRTAQMMLNYDLTFLALLLSGLYEPETETYQHRCMPHPVRKHPMVENEAIDYAADMCVLLSYEKLMDDWVDEHQVTKRTAAAVLRSGYEKAAGKYPRQAEAISQNIRLLREAEQQNCKDIDYVAGLTGRFLAEVFVWHEDIWQDELRRMGFFLGKFIYLMDAVEDVKRDKKHGNYNLFRDCVSVWESEKEREIRDMLSSMMAEAARSFERLPVVEHAEILRNILYSGVWCKYAAWRQQYMEQDKKEEKTSGEKQQ